MGRRPNLKRVTDKPRCSAQVDHAIPKSANYANLVRVVIPARSCTYRALHLPKRSFLPQEKVESVPGLINP